ncbi:MAG TPA: 2Fe-2S iron-sulfur cluster binding domain-containing protein [Streptosporangiaceae bacterium]|nr:2Fe-2S iron-sulfur cluster binding domain-containing protein [Streptosporangiaceae bacterium]
MRVTLAGQDYELRPGESVLEGMARHGVRLPWVCRAGACHSCLVRVVHGDPGTGSRHGLKDAWRDRGYALACLAHPGSDLTISFADDDSTTPATLLPSRMLSPQVLLARVRPVRPVTFRPGQHVVLQGAGMARSYSIANLPAEAEHDGIAFHVRVYPSGAFSSWLARAAPGTPVTIGAPAGECCYLSTDRDGPLLLAGTGTGIAPLTAVARDALANRHRAPIVIIHGAARPQGLYLDRRQALLEPDQGHGQPAAAAGHRPVRWRACVHSRGGDIAETVAREAAALGDPGRIRAYLCGGPTSVARMRRALFMAGMSLQNIHADAFLPAVRAAAAGRTEPPGTAAPARGRPAS